MRTITTSLLVLALQAASMAGAQAPTSERAGKRPLLNRDEGIALARSAAPASVSGPATVLVLQDTGYAVAATGSNGVTRLVNRSWVHSVDAGRFTPPTWPAMSYMMSAEQGLYDDEGKRAGAWLPHVMILMLIMPAPVKVTRPAGND